MALMPAEIVFPLCNDLSGITQEAELFVYRNGPVKTPGPWKRGRPKGSANKRKRTPRVTPHSARVASQEVAKLDKLQTHGSARKQRKEPTDATTDLGHDEFMIPSGALFPIPGVDPFDASPIKIAPYMHDLLRYYSTTAWKHVYSIERLAGCNPVSEYWLPLAFEDPALLHCLIGCACAYISGYSSFRRGSVGSNHLFEAVSIVNRRIVSGKGVSSAGTLAVVAGLAMLEKGAGRHDLWKIHMRGLKQIVGLCGGLEVLHCHPMILNKIYRADLYGSLDGVQAPFFDNLSSPSAGISYDGDFLGEGFNILDGVINLNAPLRLCIHQLEIVTSPWSAASDPSPGSQRNSRCMQPKGWTGTEAATVRHLLTSTQYTLATISSQEIPRLSKICCFTLILYSLTVLDERPSTSSVGQHIAGKLRDLLTGTELKSDHGRNTTLVPSELPVDFVSWSLFLAASAVGTARSDTKAWLLESLIDLKSSHYGNAYNWHDLRRRWIRYLWIPSIHDKIMRQLFSEGEGVCTKAVFSLLPPINHPQR